MGEQGWLLQKTIVAFYIHMTNVAIVFKDGDMYLLFF